MIKAIKFDKDLNVKIEYESDTAPFNRRELFVKYIEEAEAKGIDTNVVTCNVAGAVPLGHGYWLVQSNGDNWMEYDLENHKWVSFRIYTQEDLKSIVIGKLEQWGFEFDHEVVRQVPRRG